MATKNYYYILVLSEGKAKFVTSLDNKTRTARWEREKAPLAISKSLAEDISYCLCLNFHPAYVLKSMHKIETQIFLHEEEYKKLF